MSDASEKKGLNINTKSFVSALAVILLLMIGTYLLTFFVPGGFYERIEDENGNVMINTEAGFISAEGGIPFLKWLLSPILVLGAEGGGALIAVIAFLLVIGGVFNSLDKCGLIKYMIEKMEERFAAKRYRLMALLIFFFMALGAIIGSFEECVPLVPIVVCLSIKLGFDALTGIGMSLLACGCGFASGVCNPFTVGVAQQLAGLPMFSGAWLRAISFVLIYLLLFAFVFFYARHIERPIEHAAEKTAFANDARMNRALLCFSAILGVGIACVLCSGFIRALQDYTMIIVALTFLLAGVSATLVSGMTAKQLGGGFYHGIVSILPAVLMILMASSIKYTLVEANILDSILHDAMRVVEGLPKGAVVLFIYLIVLVTNFFIPSGSAKAFMLIPLILPIAQIFGISAQLCILAFAFGDGFSNVFYPTNPVLLISIGLADVGYGEWFRFSWRFQLVNLLLTSGILLFGLAIGY